VVKVSQAENYLENLFRQLALTDQTNLDITNPGSKNTPVATNKNNGAEE